MAQLDKKVTDYIANSAEFAQPILEHWRQLVLKNCPQVVEAIKWSIPHFEYKGDFMCVMASYKGHCSFTFIKAEIINPGHNLLMKHRPRGQHPGLPGGD